MTPAGPPPTITQRQVRVGLPERMGAGVSQLWSKWIGTKDNRISRWRARPFGRRSAGTSTNGWSTTGLIQFGRLCGRGRLGGEQDAAQEPVEIGRNVDAHAQPRLNDCLRLAVGHDAVVEGGEDDV